MSQGRILCIDDNTRNLRILRELLEDDYDVSTAGDGASGVDQVGPFRPDVILLDVMMPGTDGYEVCRRLKSSPETAGIPIVLVTARNQPEDIERGRAAGADAYLAKPFDPDALLDLVEAYVPADSGNA